MSQRHLQDEVYAASLKDPEKFWSHQANQLTWYKKPSRAFQKRTKKLQDGTTHDHWTWFPDGELNTAYNCVDRHVENGNGDNVAICWDSPVTNSKEKFTYKQLQAEIETLAGVLKEEGVVKGDVVLIYSKLKHDFLILRRNRIFMPCYGGKHCNLEPRAGIMHDQ